MTFDEMRKAFETYTNTTDLVDAAQLALWFNEAQLDLAYELGPIDSVNLTVGKRDTYVPSKDWLRLIESELNFTRQPDGVLLFPAGGSGRIWYRALPAAFSGADNSQVSELHAALHYLLPLFAASRYWETESEGDSEESTLANKWMNHYYQGKNLARNRADLAHCEIGSWQVV